MRTGIVERTAAGAFIVTLACALAAFGTSPAYAQADPPGLFSYVTTTTAMSVEQQDQVDAYEADPTTAEITIVSINPEALRTADAMTLTFRVPSESF